MSDVPEPVRLLAVQRQRARGRKDFALADALRDEIRRAGYEVIDLPAGFDLRPAKLPAAGGETLRPDDIVRFLDDPPSHAASVQWLVQGWPEDVLRGIASFRRYHDPGAIRHVVVDAAETEPALWPGDIDLIRLPGGTGWAAARNAGLERATGAFVLVVDGSVEVEGDVLGPLTDALEDPSVGLTGPFGVVTSDLREFRPAGGPECDAIEGYLMAFRRDVLQRGARFDEKFRFYRSADIEFSFRIKAMGLRTVVTPLPVRRHEHRLWANTPQDQRARLSKRNFYRFLDRWRGRTDLLLAAGEGREERRGPRRGEGG